MSLRATRQKAEELACFLQRKAAHEAYDEERQEVRDMEHKSRKAGLSDEYVEAQKLRARGQVLGTINMAWVRAYISVMRWDGYRLHDQDKAYVLDRLGKNSEASIKNLRDQFPTLPESSIKAVVGEAMNPSHDLVEEEFLLQGSGQSAVMDAPPTRLDVVRREWMNSPTAVKVFSVGTVIVWLHAIWCIASEIFAALGG
ncbi:MAG: hypothetical protein AB1696_25275 [Planctomycetota bacterium]